MDTARWERWAPATGIAFVVLFLVGYGLFAQYPAVVDPADEFTSFYADNRGAIMLAAALIGLGLLFFLAFAVTVATRVRAAGERQLAGVALGGALVWAAVVYVAMGVHAALALVLAEEGDAGAVQALAVAAVGAGVLGSFPFAAFPLALGLAGLRTGLLPRWLGWVSVAVAVVAVLAGTTWAREGLWAPVGGVAFVAVLLVLLWVAVTSVVLLRRSEPAPPDPHA